jgi:hypothetical protein
MKSAVVVRIVSTLVLVGASQFGWAQGMSCCAGDKGGHSEAGSIGGHSGGAGAGSAAGGSDHADRAAGGDHGGGDRSGRAGGAENGGRLGGEFGSRGDNGPSNVHSGPAAGASPARAAASSISAPHAHEAPEVRTARDVSRSEHDHGHDGVGSQSGSATVVVATNGSSVLTAKQEAILLWGAEVEKYSKQLAAAKQARAKLDGPDPAALERQAEVKDFEAMIKSISGIPNAISPSEKAKLAAGKKAKEAVGKLKEAQQLRQEALDAITEDHAKEKEHLDKEIRENELNLKLSKAYVEMIRTGKPPTPSPSKQ